MAPLQIPILVIYVLLFTNEEATEPHVFFSTDFWSSFFSKIPSPSEAFSSVSSFIFGNGVSFLQFVRSAYRISGFIHGVKECFRDIVRTFLRFFGVTDEMLEHCSLLVDALAMFWFILSVCSALYVAASLVWACVDLIKAVCSSFGWDDVSFPFTEDDCEEFSTAQGVFSASLYKLFTWIAMVFGLQLNWVSAIPAAMSVGSVLDGILTHGVLLLNDIVKKFLGVVWI